jgi:hypothetical protein
MTASVYLYSMLKDKQILTDGLELSLKLYGELGEHKLENDAARNYRYLGQALRSLNLHFQNYDKDCTQCSSESGS